MISSPGRFAGIYKCQSLEQHNKRAGPEPRKVLNIVVHVQLELTDGARPGQRGRWVATSYVKNEKTR